MVKASFQLDALGVSLTSKSIEAHERALRILTSTTNRLPGGWETGLLWKSDAIALPGSKENARRRLFGLETKLDKDPVYASIYYGEVEKLIDQGYAIKLKAPLARSDREWYLPHFGVTNVNKPGKTRVVFDAAAKRNSVYLNDKLLPGPDLLQSLFGILMRFRQECVAFTSDIQDMFLRIKVREQDQCSQMFLYREKNRLSQPNVYRLTTLVFGARSSP